MKFGIGSGIAALLVVGSINSASASLVAYYKMDDPFWPPVSDSSGNFADAFNVGAATPGAAGHFNSAGAYSSAGSGYLLTPGLPTGSASGGNVTISTWYKASSGGNGGVVISELGAAAINSGWHDSQIEVQTNGSVKYRVWQGPTNLSSGPATFDEWHNAVLRYDAGTDLLSGFLDGVLVAQGLVGGRQVPGANVFYGIGAGDGTNLGNGKFFDGFIDDTKFYNEALSDAAIADLFTETAPGIAPEPATVSLLGLAAIGLAAFARRRSVKTAA